MSDNLPEVIEHDQPGTSLTQAALTIDQLTEQVALIQMAMERVMKKDEHYGVIPGTGTKPTLLKAGAEKLCLLFRLAPSYETHEERQNLHYTVRVTCSLSHIDTGAFVGGGEALCSTYESRYAFRKGGRHCPSCGAVAIIKGREEYGGGWLCFGKKGGCGRKFPDGDAAIESQKEGRVENDDLPDTWNTVLKMACKRALVAAVLNATAASDIFTQDIEDLNVERPAPPPPTPASPESISELREALFQVSWKPDIWDPEVVVANAKRQFRPEIKKLDDLTEDEVQKVLSGITTWSVANPTPVPGGTGVTADDIPFGDADDPA